jgi:glycosyltransferase involved in cell wall biosynthesis
MRIVQIIPDFGLGGIQKAGCVLADEMARLGHAAAVIGFGDGPRRNPVRANPAHRIALSGAGLGSLLRELSPDVVHVHADRYREDLVDVAAAACPNALLVTTPVFGRPPEGARMLRRTRTCCVGIYSFYRLSRWLGLSPQAAIDRGLAYVPLTPCQQPALELLDPVDTRRALGIPADAFVVGRIGRKTVSKWHDGTAALVDALLGLHEDVVWLSVGHPDEMDRVGLQRRWGPRFLALPETSDFAVLVHAYRALDVQAFFSRHGECFASTICEAAGLGVPTIALATPFFDNGQAEQVIDGTTGYLVSEISGCLERVAQLHRNRDRLALLKASTLRHARERWGAARAAGDLVALYAYWRGGSAPGCPYVGTMLAEQREFARTYRARMSDLFGERSLARGLLLSAGLVAAESWPVFKIARAVKRARTRLLSRAGYR